MATEGTIERELKATQDYAEATKQAYELAQARYRHGSESFLTVLDSQRQYVSAQTQLAVAQQARAMSLVTLYKVLGGGAVDLDKKSDDKAAQTAEVKSEA